MHILLFRHPIRLRTADMPMRSYIFSDVLPAHLKTGFEPEFGNSVESLYTREN